MSSDINPTKPEAGTATTASVRDNFTAAKDEIEALQTSVQAAQDTADAAEALAETNAPLSLVSVTATGTCTANTLELCAASSNITRTIPDGLNVGARIAWKDAGQFFTANTLTVVPPSGSQIENQATDETLLVSQSYLAFELQQTETDIWRIL